LINRALLGGHAHCKQLLLQQTHAE